MFSLAECRLAVLIKNPGGDIINARDDESALLFSRMNIFEYRKITWQKIAAKMRHNVSLIRVDLFRLDDWLDLKNKSHA